MPEAHLSESDDSFPRWHGWHAFRRGLATNLHALGVDDKEIQAILRHGNVKLTQNIYIKSIDESRRNSRIDRDLLCLVKGKREKTAKVFDWSFHISV